MARLPPLHDADEASLAVIADALIDAGEPRGELIALSLAEQQPKQQERLVRRHRARWLGQALHATLSTKSTFLHGRLDAIEPRKGVPLATVAEACTSPELRSVTRIRRGHASRTVYEALLQSPQLVRLIDLQLHPDLLVGPTPFEPLAPIERVLLDHPADAAQLARLTHTPALASIEHVHLSGDHARHGEVTEQIRLLASALGLRTMRVGGYPEAQLPVFFETGLEQLWAWVHGVVREPVPTLIQAGWCPPGTILPIAARLHDRIEAIELWDIGTRGIEDALEKERQALRQRHSHLEIRILRRPGPGL